MVLVLPPCRWFKGPVPDVDVSDDGANGFVKVAPHHQDADPDTPDADYK